MRLRPSEDAWLAQIAAAAAAEAATRAVSSGGDLYSYTATDVVRALIDRAMAAGVGYSHLREDLMRQAQRVQAVRASRTR
jgi:hypothetical protein